MPPVNLFDSVTEKGSYTVGYIVDGWTKELVFQAKSPNELMMKTQNELGDISNVTFVERS